MSRVTLALGILLVTLLASYSVLSTADVKDPLSRPEEIAPAGGIPGKWILEEVRLRAWEGARQTLDARAAKIEIRPKRVGIFTIPALREARVSDLDARVSKTGGGVTRVRADRARIDPLRPFWLLEGNARVEESGTTLACAKLKWNPASGPLPSSRCRPIATAAFGP